MKKILVFVMASFFMIPAMAQDKAAEKWRNKNWNPKKGNYFFNKVFTWEFRNDHNEYDDEKIGEFSIYVDEKSGTFLFTPEAYVFSGPMTDFIIADQNGEYIVAHTEEFGEKTYDVYKMDVFKEIKSGQDSVKYRFNEFLKATGETRFFGENKYGWQTFSGDEYLLMFEELPDDTTFFNLTSMVYSFLPVYLFNDLEIEAKLPYPFGYSGFIPENMLVLRELHDDFGNITEVKLKHLSPTEYFVDLKEYKRSKDN